MARNSPPGRASGRRKPSPALPQARIGFFPFRVLDTVLMGRTAHLGLFAMPGERDREAARQALRGLHPSSSPRPTTRASAAASAIVLFARALAQERAFW